MSQRLCDLLLSFPAAAIGGVQWQVLVRKYEERYAARLDLAALGHSAPLPAATALLWDVLRIVDKEDTDNPVVAVEDAVALTPQPGLLGCWPSLYQVLCQIVLNNGLPEAAAADGQESPKACNLLLSQLRPLLECHWHASFDESSLGFRNEEGSFIRLKKLKHLLHAVLRWRDQRQAWQRSHNAKRTAVDEVLTQRLELVASEKHNDLVLRCFASQEPAAARGVTASPCRVAPKERAADRVATACAARGPSCSLQLELERLRVENGQLRARNQALEEGSWSMTTSPGTPAGRPQGPCQLPADVFDDPFEPPPEMRAWRARGVSVASCSSSTHLDTSDAVSEAHSNASWATSGTPLPSSWQSQCTSATASGATTPNPRLPGAQQNCTYVPMWFPFVQAASTCFVDVSVIPRGIVQSAREQFERVAGQ